MPFMRFWEQLKNIFSSRKTDHLSTLPQKNSKERILRHEVIQRNPSELAYYENWSASPTKTDSLDWLHREFNAYRLNGNCDPAITFLMIPSVNGFAIKFDESRWEYREFAALFDYFKNILSKTENYWVQVSDTKTISSGKQTETIERHYLKPPTQFDLNYGEKKNQKFGNLMITLNTINGKADTLKFSATHYNDHLFEKAYQFDLLMELLCQK
jgi:hypothetical protein